MLLDKRFGDITFHCGKLMITVRNMIGLDVVVELRSDVELVKGKPPTPQPRNDEVVVPVAFASKDDFSGLDRTN